MLPEERERCISLGAGLPFWKCACPCLNCLRLAKWAETCERRISDYGSAMLEAEEMVDEAFGTEEPCDDREW